MFYNLEARCSQLYFASVSNWKLSSSSQRLGENLSTNVSGQFRFQTHDPKIPTSARYHLSFADWKWFLLPWKYFGYTIELRMNSGQNWPLRKQVWIYKYIATRIVFFFHPHPLRSQKVPFQAEIIVIQLRYLAVNYCQTNPSFGKKLIIIYYFHYNRKSMLHPITCTSSDLDKTAAMFQKDPGKIVGGVAFTRYPVHICFVNNWLSSNCEKCNKL